MSIRFGVSTAGSQLVVALSSVAGKADQVCYINIYFDHKFQMLLFYHVNCCKSNS